MKLTYEINISEKDLGLDYKYDVGTSSLDLMFLNENGFRMEFAVLPGNNNIDEIHIRIYNNNNFINLVILDEYRDHL